MADRVEGDLASAIGGFAGDLGGAVLAGSFNARSAKKQMDFQERMASTQYQRAANDLERAGLNRVLALGNPAHSPSGASASVNAPALGSAVNNARVANAQVKNYEAGIDNVKAQTMATVADGELKGALREESEARRLNIMEDTVLKTIQGPYWKSQTGLTEANTGKVADERLKIAQEIRNLQASIPGLIAQGKKTEAEAAQAEVMKMVFKMLEPVAQAAGGWVARNVKEGLDNIGEVKPMGPLRGWMLEHMTKRYRERMQYENSLRNR